VVMSPALSVAPIGVVVSCGIVGNRRFRTRPDPRGHTCSRLHFFLSWKSLQGLQGPPGSICVAWRAARRKPSRCLSFAVANDDLGNYIPPIPESKLEEGGVEARLSLRLRPCCGASSF
jgi:hypothetical protein